MLIFIFGFMCALNFSLIVYVFFLLEIYNKYTFLCSLSEKMAFLGQDPVRCKIIVNNKCLPKIK